MSDEDLFRGCGVEIKLPSEDTFLKVKETLTRIGIASRKDKTLYQSCHILHKRGRYAIVHFKELFVLDGKTNNFSDEDKARRNTIVNLLSQWELVDVVQHSKVEEITAPLSQIKIIPHKEKQNWQLVSKYSIGVKS